LSTPLKGFCVKTAIACALSVVGFFAVGRAVAVDSAAPGPQKPTYKIDKRSSGELRTTTDKLKVLSAPKAGSKVLQEYDKGAMMAVLGEATGTGYLYVSPCNACANGFVSKTEFRAKTER
jgi:hypothetical protein